MNAIFSTLFKQDLLDAETRYFSISDRLGNDLHERVKNSVRSIIRWEGGDHVGPHGSTQMSLFAGSSDSTCGHNAARKR